MVGTEGKTVHKEQQQIELRPKIEIVRVPSIERASFRPLDGVQLRATYSHMRVGTYCPEPEPPAHQIHLTPCKRPPTNELTKKHKKNLGPVSRLLRRRHHATSLATKSCDNIYSVNKNNSFFEWKHGSNPDQGRQSNSLDWRASRSINRNSSNLDRRKASRSAEQLSRSGTLQTPSTKSKIVSLLRRLSPRLPRPSSKGSLPSSPSICPWVQVEYSGGGSGGVDVTDGIGKCDDATLQQKLQQESDYIYQREVRLNEIKKRAIVKCSPGSKQELFNDATETVTKKKRSPRSSLQLNVPSQDKQDTICQAVQHEDLQEQQQHQACNNNEVKKVPEEASGTSLGEVVQRNQQRRPVQQRPHSLAVQPLNYQRLDPELQLLEPQLHHRNNQGVASGAAAGGARRPATASSSGGPREKQRQQPAHPNMTSQESIGSCSLDVERSASDRSDVNAGSLSEKTLHSLSISCNGEQCEENVRNSGGAAPISNGHDGQGELGDDAEQLTSRTCTGTGGGGSKKPSYLGLACSISGYSGITRYDSKLREGFRSRDSSPGARLITRDTSPAGFRANDNLSVGGPQSLKSISPLAMEKRNGYSNGGGHSEVDRGYTFAGEPKLSPIRAGSPNKKYSPVGARIAGYNQQNNRSSYSSISSSSPKSNNVSNCHNESNILNGSSETENCSLNSSTEKSFIQQRVERLYGPGALAQGFFFKRSTTTTTTSTMTKLDSSNNSEKSSNNNNSSLDDSSIIEESLKNLPVLRHLRPEFRAQLPVVSQRKPTDGTEQIIKPLKRISIPSEKNDAKETTAIPEKTEIDVKIDNKMTASTTSLTDQQPAAPKVILPVNPVEYNVNTPKHNIETPEAVQEKDGHYFMSVLNKERERLISLAEKAESELENTEPSDLPEEAAGKLRSAAGKARLLATQKMKQFEGLCQKNINQIPGEEFPTTSEDLAGFWDMVMLQVVQVNDLFDHLDCARKLQWKDIQEPKSSPSSPQNGSASKRRQTPASKVKPSANSEALRKAREAREQSRKQLIEERRRAMRENANKSVSAVEIFVPET